MSVIWDTLKVQWMPWYIKVNCLLKHSTDSEDTNSANLEQNFYIYFDNRLAKISIIDQRIIILQCIALIDNYC